MYRFLLAPKWLALHAALVAVVVSFGLLGYWQLSSYRAQDQLSQQIDPVAVPLAALAGPGQPLRADAIGRTVTVEGTYDPGEQLVVPGRRFGDRDGLHVVTPLVTPEGAVVPVRRGWLPDGEDPAGRAPAGPVTVTGVLQASETGRSAGSDVLGQALPADQVPFLATPELMRKLSYSPERLVEGYVSLTEERPAVAPAPRPVPAEAGPPPVAGASRWQNFSYALQWWVFAGAAVFFWRLFVRNAAAERRTPPAPQVP